MRCAAQKKSYSRNSCEFHRVKSYTAIYSAGRVSLNNLLRKEADLQVTLSKNLSSVLMLFLVLLTAHAVSAMPSQGVAQTQDVFNTGRASVLQIRTILKGSTSQSSTGSGFYVSDDGLVITNYHVISSHALEPKIYALEGVGSDGQGGELTLLAVDVLHDLALLQQKGGRFPYLRFHKDNLAKGTRGFSFGNPQDIGLTIVEGTYNGLRDHSFYDTIHFTGAINSGMSGGPVVTKAGNVFGINVATMVNGQLIGFLVPAHFASELVERWRTKPIVPLEFQPEIALQLSAHSDALLKRVMSAQMPIQRLGNYSAPDQLDPYMRCWANSNRDPKKFYEASTYYCGGSASVFVDQDVSAGNVSFTHDLVQGDALDPFRFGTVLESNFKYTASGWGEGNSKHFTKYACQDSVVNLHDMRVKAALCLREYRMFPGLYDVILRLSTLREDTRALQTKLNLRGVNYDSGMAFVKHYMDAIRWND